MNTLNDQLAALEEQKKILEAVRERVLKESVPQEKNEAQRDSQESQQRQESQESQEKQAPQEAQRKEPPELAAPMTLPEVEEKIAAVDKKIKDTQEQLRADKKRPDDQINLDKVGDKEGWDQQKEFAQKLSHSVTHPSEPVSQPVDLQVAQQIKMAATHAGTEQVMDASNAQFNAPPAASLVEAGLLAAGAAVELIKHAVKTKEFGTRPAQELAGHVAGAVDAVLDARDETLPKPRADPPMGAPEPAEPNRDSTPRESGAQMSARADAQAAALEASREAALQQKRAEPPMPAPSAEELAAFMPKPEQKFRIPEQIEVPAEQINAEPTRMPLQANRVVDGAAQAAYEKQVHELKEKQSGRNEALEKQIEQAQQVFDKRAERTGMDEETRTKLQGELDNRFQQLRDAQLKIQEQAINLIVPPPNLT
jgi:hypothetical protein